ncbi:tannase and feruloyl esterase [Macroventuria anomochaeta]|uniref:Tannase and feruloyl esterase n=1 Tax=Macroventuria anomochaeta TaxID=301207 RepID=A0ACB6RIX1_9PLEO|nr:tannase and feruloyl esterase [Macroventuria anomochaeta]KAF2621936.1 tannase and feruloyl esterase [Macroventuria anomochaeta]
MIEDFAYRALPTGVVLGKETSKTFYGKSHNKSYYLGCSTGGRHGWKTSMECSFNNLTSWSFHFLPLIGTEGAPTFVPLNMWPTIHQYILKQCDEVDGVADEIFELADLCDYDPSGLLIFSPLYATDDSVVYPRLQPGAEATEAPFTYFSGQHFAAADWFSYAIYNNSYRDPLSLKPEDYHLSADLNLFNIGTWDGGLSAFKDRGGKVLHYHGLVDAIISCDNSPRYYEHVSQTMNLDSKALDEFYEYFRISGMVHCGGGPRATFIGNQRRNTASLDPEENVLTAIVRWVEESIAPETITGTAYKNGSQSAGVDFKKRHCRWPYRNAYKGIGGYKDPNSWERVVDEKAWSDTIMLEWLFLADCTYSIQ